MRDQPPNRVVRSPLCLKVLRCHDQLLKVEEFSKMQPRSKTRGLSPASGALALLALVVAAAGSLFVRGPAQAQGSPTAVPILMSHTTVAIALANLSVQPGDSFDVDVTINTDKPVRNWQLTFLFDPSLVQVTGVDEGSFLKAWASAHSASTAMAY